MDSTEPLICAVLGKSDISGDKNAPEISQQRHTPRHFNCPVCQGTRKMLYSPLSKDMDFESAAQSFIDSRSAPVAVGRIRKIAPRTLRDYEKKASRLKIFFGGMKLE